MDTSQKYLDLLKAKYKAFPAEISPKDRKIGVELEFHVVTLDGSKPDFKLLENLLHLLIPALNFNPIELSFDNTYIKGEKDGDVISHDYTYGFIELSLGPCLDLQSIDEKAINLINQIQQFLKKYDLTLLPLGLNPFDWSLDLPVVKNQYYQMVANAFDQFNPKRTYSYSNAMAFICASQVQLDLSLQELPNYINVVNNLNWVKALLFANSPKYLQDQNAKCLCFRDLLWEDSFIAFHKQNVGVRDEIFSSYEEVLLDILNSSLIFVIRKNKNIYFKPLFLGEFLSKDKIPGWYVENEKIIPIEFQPQESDIQFLRQYNAISITYRGTIETRTECAQPFDALMSSAAFHLGIISNFDKVVAHLKSIEDYTSKYSFSDLRKKAIFKGYDIGQELNFDTNKFIYELLLIVKEGLVLREKNEECYLDCLFDRFKNKSNPALEWFKYLEKGLSITEMIARFSSLGAIQ